MEIEGKWYIKVLAVVIVIGAVIGFHYLGKYILSFDKPDGSIKDVWYNPLFVVIGTLSAFCAILGIGLIGFLFGTAWLFVVGFLNECIKTFKKGFKDKQEEVQQMEPTGAAISPELLQRERLVRDHLRDQLKDLKTKAAELPDDIQLKEESVVKESVSRKEIL